MQNLIKTISAAALGLSLSMGAVHANEATQDASADQGNGAQSASTGAFDFANPMTWFNMTGVTGQESANGYAWHPLKPQSWADIASPENHNTFHKAMTNPATYTQFMQPAFYMEFMNPANYMAWMNPASYEVFMNPATFSYWMTPDAYMHFIDPNMYAGMLNMNNYMAFMNPATYMAWMDPSIYTKMMDPSSYAAAVQQ